MHFYTAKVRLGGNVLNEVDKIGISAPEVICLRAIHGADALAGLRKTGERKVNPEAERDRLDAEYSVGLHAARTSLVELFGPGHRELPMTAPGVVDDDPDAEGAPGAAELTD